MISSCVENRPPRWVIWIALLVCWTAVRPAARGHVPVPESVLNPQSVPEAWNVLRLASANIDHLLWEGRLEEIPDQASLCPPSLRLLARLAEPAAKHRETTVGTVRAGAAISSLAQACVAGDRSAANAALAKWHQALDALAADEDPRLVGATVFFCPMHPDTLSLSAGSACPKCGMLLVPRRIPYSFVYANSAGESSMTMEATGNGIPTTGQTERVKVRLQWNDGKPVTDADLLVAHTQRIHLLIVDPALEDYHHEHPTAIGPPGEYEFAFTPRKTSSYRIYADVVPAATGIQEYIAAVLPTNRPPTGQTPFDISRENQFEAEAGGLHFQMTTGGITSSTLHACQTQALEITVTDKNGDPVRRLEPVMNAFAHLVGFYDDGHTVVHLHPAGADVDDPAMRGGPSLEFRLYSPKAGFMRLYCQVSVDGKMIYAPFGVNILP